MTSAASRTIRGAALLARFDAAEARLTALAATELPPGRTQPDQGGEETWSARQVWGHLSEFTGYWTEQARGVLAAPVDVPATFGRRVTDDSRLDPIRAADSETVARLLARCVEGLGAARTLVAGLAPDDWERVGEHVVRGPMTVGDILERNIGNHLDEHADQLERLAAEASPRA
jgi:hypothetical protein